MLSSFDPFGQVLRKLFPIKRWDTNTSEQLTIAVAKYFSICEGAFDPHIGP